MGMRVPTAVALLLGLAAISSARALRLLGRAADDGQQAPSSSSSGGAAVVAAVCVNGPESGSKHVFKHPWNAKDEQLRLDALASAYRFMENFTHPESRRSVDMIAFFVDASDGVSEKAKRSEAAGRARRMASSLDRKLRGKWSNGTFGQIFGVRKDFLDSLDVVLYEERLGLDMAKSPFLQVCQQAYRKCHQCFTRGQPVKPGDETGAALEALLVDEARFRFGARALLGAKLGIRELFAPLVERLLSATDYDEHTAALVAQLGALASGLGRYQLHAGELKPAEDWARAHFDEALDSGDADAVANLASLLKLYGCDEHRDMNVLQGARLLISKQKAS